MPGLQLSLPTPPSWVVGKEPVDSSGSVGGGHGGYSSAQLPFIMEQCARAPKHTLLHTVSELLQLDLKTSASVDQTGQPLVGGGSGGGDLTRSQACLLSSWLPPFQEDSLQPVWVGGAL